MKKLKLQKALLAICLALPLTLTTHHAISAMETNIEITDNKADDKDAKEQQTLQNKLELIANKETHTEALQYYVGITNPPKLGEAEYKQFLQYYIKNNIVKYLALIIQAKNNLIQFPETQNIKQSITSEAIYRMLINNEPNTPNPIYSKAAPAIQQLIQTLQEYFSSLDKEQMGRLPADEKIFKEIFTKVDPYKDSYRITNALKGICNSLIGLLGTKKEETNNLTALIENYINPVKGQQEQTEEEKPNDFILRYTDDTVKQLHKEAAAFDEKNEQERQKLEEIANQIEKFFKAYKTKHAAKEEEKKESNQKELNNSIQNSQLQEDDDIKIEDYKEDNITTNRKEELEINKGAEQEKDVPVAQRNDQSIINKTEDEQKSIKDEEENKEEIINTSKKEEIEVTEQEEEEEKIDKQNNYNLNIPLSVISEEKKVDNDKENKEEVESPKGKSKEPEIKAVQDETQKEVKDTQTENKKSDDTDIEEIKQLINEWQQKKEEINKDKEEKLTQLEKDIKELEQKYDKIVNGDEDALC